MFLTASREGLVISVHKDAVVGKMYSVLLREGIVVVDETEILKQKGASNEH